jgi:hypothetical protein
VRIVVTVLVLMFLLAGCATSPGIATSIAPVSAGTTSQSPATSPTSAPSLESSAAADWPTYRDGKLRPALNQLVSALNAWAEAFNKAATSGATDADRAAYGAAVRDLQNSLANAQEVADSDVTPCGAVAAAQAKAFVQLVVDGTKDILGKESVDLGKLAVAGSLLESASAMAPKVKTAIDEACS